MTVKRNSWSMKVEDASSCVTAMRRQEEDEYRCTDYLSQLGDADSNLTGWSAPIDAECRFKMADWCYQIVDLCKLKRETVAISVSLLDRYVSTDSGRHALKSRKDYQLASMTALYMTTKLYETQVMEPAMVSHLSRGSYSEEEVTNMELSMLEALRWRVNPPTALAFVRCFVSLLTSSIDEETRDDVYDVARFQTELAVNKYEFAQTDSSAIAFASIANALELVDCKDSLRKDSLKSISQAASLEPKAPKLKHIQKRLFHAMLSSALVGKTKRNMLSPTTMGLIKSSEDTPAEPVSSPRCVRKQT